ncbi:lipoate--protein ligase [Proteiniclasticum sp. SCR006]|uniref:lipoate--protein ligase n=1 Tax=Proteiniclasticum aestuarii TaxID=2817862 RepID=A0A939H8Y1_9CLOT|nr:lipoate--protein ligase [Proteiniclasticum aestuarii]MBO1263830.1 lipoate--protein ligase [Proteiniclasticum aestuarii]
MRYIISENTDAYFNLASEEYLLKHTDEEIFYLWRNDNAIIVGKNQNTLSEINVDYVKEKNIKVVRRLTGGGAVYHDLGNLNYTFIENKKKNFNDFRGFCEPITTALNEMGVEAEFSGRNDMTIEGKKFSGTAQCKYKDRVMHHGTLLFSSEKADISGALKPREIKFSGKSVKSVSSRITNISEHLEGDMDVIEFRNRVMKSVAGGMDQVTTFSDQEVSEIIRLRDEKYAKWEWNYGHSPKFEMTREGRFPGGTLEVTLEVKKGVIEKIRIYGDFFGTRDISALESALTGVAHNEEAIGKVFQNLDIHDYMVNITKEDLLGLLI